LPKSVQYHGLRQAPSLQAEPSQADVRLLMLQQWARVQYCCGACGALHPGHGHRHLLNLSELLSIVCRRHQLLNVCRTVRFSAAAAVSSLT
jgi:hypothetical protein